MRSTLVLLAAALLAFGATAAQKLTLDALVTPSTLITRDGKPITFALYGLVEFQSLQQLFPYVDAQAGRWTFSSQEARDEFAAGLFRRGVASRVVSMVTEEPWEVLLTHTAAQIDAAVSRLPDPVFRGAHWQLNASEYRTAFHRVRDRWLSSVNCWSQSPLIAGRVLSNFYLIPEGFHFDGHSFDSLEHVWQAIKYHPSVEVTQLLHLIELFAGANWSSWFARVDGDQALYLANAHSVEFLRANLASSRLAWFRDQLAAQPPHAHARELQQRVPGSLRFTAVMEKILWGDFADVCHLLVYFAPSAPLPSPALLNELLARQFDAIYLPGSGRRFAFISAEFRAVMLELFKGKFLAPATQRFREVMRSIPRSLHLDHYLNDGDAPDIPLSIYVAYLNQVRDLALELGVA